MTDINEMTKQCPYCKSEIPAEAVKCKFCGEFVDKKEEKVKTNTGPTKNCPYCKTSIPKNASRCPNCSADLRIWIRRHPIITIFLLIIGLGIWSSNFAKNEYEKRKLLEQSSGFNIQVETGENQNFNKLSEEVKQKSRELIGKVEIIDKKVKDEYGFPHIVIKLKNNTGKDIDGLSFKASFTDNFDRSLKASISGEEYFRGMSQETLKKGDIAERERQLSLFENATKIKDFEIIEIHFTDGQTVSLE